MTQSNLTAAGAMKDSPSQIVAAQWSRLGVLFNVSPSRQTPALEHLLIDTAKQIPDNPRLFIMAATWLGQYSRLVAKHRLTQIVSKLQDANTVAALGLLLDTVGTMCHTDALDTIKSVCRPAPVPMPLFIVDRASPGMAQFAQARASGLSKRWNLWAEAIELRPDAIRPLDWIMEQNPSLQIRAIFSGTLRASVLVCLEHDVPAEASEAQLARLCGVTRKAIHEALDHLELCNLIRRSRAGRNYQVALKHSPPANRHITARYCHDDGPCHRNKVYPIGSGCG